MQDTQPNSSQPSSFPFQKLIALGTFLLLQNITFFHTNSNLAMGVQLASWVILSILALGNKRSNLLTWGAILLTIMQLVTLSTLASPTTTAIALISIAWIGVTTTYLLASRTLWIRSLMELVLSPLILLGSYLQTAIRTLGDFLSSRWTKGITSAPTTTPEASTPAANGLAKSVIVGLVLGLPVVVILISMFSAADPVFASFINQLVGPEFLERLQQRILWSVWFLALAIPVIRLHRQSTFTSPVGFLGKWSLVREMTVVMILVAATLGLFLAVQWPYVFVHVEKETSLSAFGVATYSEYVRKGFEELLKAAAFLFALVWLGLTIWRQRRTPHRPILLWVQIIVLGEFGIFLLSLFRRVWLYQELHGWTLAKLYGTWGLVGLVGLVVTLALRHFWNKRWIRVELVWIALWLLIGSWWNAEQFIISSRHLPTVNERVDYMYLARMSADGREGWLLSYDWAREVLDRQSTAQPELYTENDRREIAYAGRVILQLSEKYYQSLEINADTQTLKNDLQEVFAYKFRYYQTEIQRLKSLAAESEQVLKRADLSPDDRKFYEVERDDYSRDALSYAEPLEKITRSQTALSSEKTNWADVVKLDSRGGRIFTYDDDGLTLGCPGRFQANLCEEGVGDMFEIDYREYDATEMSLRDTLLRRALRANTSGEEGLRTLREEIGIQELLRLQTQYLSLRQRISRQPENERGYSEDVSLNSPLMW